MHTRICCRRDGLLWAFLVLLTADSLSAEQVYDRRLLQKASVNLDKVPLNQAFEDLAKKYNVPVRLDDSLAANGVLTEPFTLNVEGITLQSLLKLICMIPSAPITFHVNQGVITVLSSEASQDTLVEVEYRLTGLGPLTANVAEIALVLESCTVGPWFEVDGVGGKLLSLSPQAVKVSQDRTTHEQIADLFAELQSVIGGRKPAASPIDATNERLEKALARPKVVGSGEMTLTEGLEHLLGDAKVPYFVQTRLLGEEGINLNRQVTLTAGRKPLHEHLTAMLAPLKLGFHVQSEVVIITTQMWLDEDLITKVYDVRKLLNPMVFPQDIADRLQQIPETGPWFDIDGIGGTVEPIGPLLVVRQSRGAHQKISQSLGGR